MTIDTQSSTSLKISWSPPKDLKGLAITKYWAVVDDGALTYQTPVDRALATDYTYTVVVADKGKDFRFKVVAENSLGQGEYSDPIILTAVDQPAAPVLSLVAGSRTTDGMRLKFTPDADTGESPIIGYLLYRDQGLAGSTKTLIYDGTGSPENIYRDEKGLKTGLDYTYDLYSLNKIYQSSAAGSLVVTVGTVPDPPI